MVAPILRLPREIRLRIWYVVGLPKDAYIYLDVIQDTKERAKGQRRTLFDNSSASIYNLLLTCREIYSELSQALYSCNRIITHRLEPLHHFQASSLLSLRSLKVVLHATSGSETHCCGSRYPHELTALNSLTAEGQFILARWKAASTLLSRHIEPNQLDFSLICDTADERTAHDVLECLRGFPVLANFHVRLASRQNPALEKLAQEISDEVTGRHTPKSFRFFSLPPEIRLDILEHTDLVAPRRKIAWRAADSEERYEGGLFYAQRREYFGLDDFCCDSTRTGCFCSHVHAASATCRCWRSPHSLFLISKAFCREAQDVFYKSNRFRILLSSRDANRITDFTQELPSPRLAASRFFTDGIPVNAFTRLRWLELLRFSSLAGQKNLPEQARNDWFQTLAFVERSGGTNLDFVALSSRREALPPYEDWRTGAFDTIRGIVSAGFWPLDETIGPRLHTRQLLVALSGDGIEVEYNLRRRSEPLRKLLSEQSHHRKMGPKLATRVVTFSSPDSDETVEGSGASLVEWIETIWVKNTSNVPEF
ncbi:hypothetical protein GGR57DRAFT_501142 [Xylariaceae sp. FL1272]|nr:hypothetical protein GGR57DRAFT_501142 [Xylariaceae sp. FL1272]